MREFMRKAIKKSETMNESQLKNFVKLIADEYALLDSTMDSLQGGVIVVNKNNKIIRSNRTAARILESHLSDSQEKNVWEYVNEIPVRNFIAATIQNESGRISKEFNLCTDDKTKYIEVVVLPLVKEKKIKGTVITIYDITEKRKEEIKTRRLESLASLTNVAAAVAHEIKNPLAAISIHLQLLKKMPAEKTSCEKAKKHIFVIEEEIERLNKIVVDFLFAVRPLKFEFAPVDVNSVLKNLCETFFDEFDGKGITMSLNLAENLPKIQGDERFLRQVFMNILTNAGAAMPSGGFLDIATNAKTDFITVTVSDSGQGILPENLNKIFEPYFTTKHDGTGLGLTIAYKIIKEHGGDISVYSDFGMGTSFRFMLPIVRRGFNLLLSDKTNRAEGAGAKTDTGEPENSNSIRKKDEIYDLGY